ncbi:MAG: lamin tail domain-containing protein [Kofleriaceae bacterium]
MYLARLIPWIAILAGCADVAPELEHDQSLDGIRLRVMAGNLTGASSRYDDGAGIRIFQGIRPDVALVQEFRYTAGSRAFVDTAFGPEFQFVEGAGNIRNAVVSRYPIVESGEWDDPSVGDRGFTWARIDVPGPTDLWAVSLHLLTSSSSARNTEARALVQRITAVVPSTDWLVLGGDLNTSSRSESAISTLGQVIETASPYPADRNGDGDTNASRSKPYDWLLANDDLDARETPVVVGGSSFTNGLVVDTRAYSPITELAPARSGDSGTRDMQHMGVVRDFDLPSETGATLHVDAPNGGEQWAVGSAHMITWTSNAVDTVDIDYAANGTTFKRIASAVASSGSFAWTVPGPATSTARIRITSTAGSTGDASDAAFATTETPLPGGDVILNEVLANEPGTATAGEFIELVNPDTGAINLSGWSLADSVATRHVFPAGTTLAPGARLVIFGNTASTGALGLSNSGDTARLIDGAGATVDTFTFGGSPDGVSFNRSPDATTGPFVLHTELSSQPASPNSAP